jgi:hypothetical protein
MIYYSSHPDLYKVIEMFNQMFQEDKKFLFFDNEHFFVKLTNLHYKVIKGQCVMLLNEEGKLIGFTSFDLNNDSELFITEMYVDPKHRLGSLPVLLEMIIQLKMYMRPIHFVVHLENKRMQTLAKFIKAKVIKSKDIQIEYVIHI